MQKLVGIRVRPYYIYQCELVKGAGHFRTPVGKGLEIMEGLRGHTSGYAVPQYIVDAPGGGGKIPVMPNYLVSYSDHKVVLRNYEGYITTYEEPPPYTPHDRSTCRWVQHTRPAPGQAGHTAPRSRKALAIPAAAVVTAHAPAAPGGPRSRASTPSIGPCWAARLMRPWSSTAKLIAAPPCSSRSSRRLGENIGCEAALLGHVGGVDVLGGVPRHLEQTRGS